MPELPESIDPKSEQILFEKLAQERADFDDLQFIRRHMRLIYQHEHKNEEERTTEI
jgi:hypothetical protein